ncbi:hypothetical protein M231_01350 [Tremella mesenterica]|uniref:CUE domain-containing protein n=1 Tax=Tremella mesenterica TaxID=5217 RepID=A0A4Q1BTN6_TREME|nr:hypothetical protein M231_01350 [Tremella mesenterica]
MSTEDIISSLFVVALLAIFIRWWSKPKTPAQTQATRNVTPAMVESVHSTFPHIQKKDIIWSLSKTDSAQATSEEILEKGFLPSAPASFQPPPSLLPLDPNPVHVATQKIAENHKTPSLIEKYGLASRLPSRKGKEKADLSPVMENGNEKGVEAGAGMGMGVGGKWEDTREKRERELRERKERMILEARRRLLESQSRQ